MFCTCLLGPSTLWISLITLLFCSGFVWITCLLVRKVCWSLSLALCWRSICDFRCHYAPFMKLVFFFHLMQNCLKWSHALAVFFSFMSIYCSSLSLLIHFDLKSILSDIKTVIPACFLDLLAWSTFFQPFTLRKYLSLRVVCISVRHKKVAFSALIQYVNLCLFIWELRQLTTNAIIE